MPDTLVAMCQNEQIDSEGTMCKIHFNFLQHSDRALTMLVTVPVALMLVGFIIAVCAILA
jgi:hypothetical protein